MKMTGFQTNFSTDLNSKRQPTTTLPTLNSPLCYRCGDGTDSADGSCNCPEFGTQTAIGPAP